VSLCSTATLGCRGLDTWQQVTQMLFSTVSSAALWDHRMIERPGLERITMLIQFQPLLCAGSPTSSPGCPEPHPAWPGMPAGMGHPPLLGQPVQCVTALWGTTVLLRGVGTPPHPLLGVPALNLQPPAARRVLGSRPAPRLHCGAPRGGVMLTPCSPCSCRSWFAT